MAPIDPEIHVSGLYVIVRNIMLNAVIPKVAEGVKAKAFRMTAL
jgi:hypothetical protein